MEFHSVLMLLASTVILLLGCVHLLYTFRGRKLLPRDAGLIEAMKTSTLVITAETTVWKAWIGFNASHSMGAILFGLIFGYLSVANPSFLFGSVYLQTVGFALLLGFFILGRMYWFKVPFVGITVSLVCYVASIVLAHA